MSAARARMGVDVGGTKLEAAVLDSHGAVLWRHRVATPQGDYPGTVAAVAALVAQGNAACGATPTVGLGTPGAVDPSNGLMKNANSTCLNGQPFAADVARAVGRPVRLANDADCLALSEATDGAGAGARVVFGVIVGTGVGAGVVVNGRLLSGPNAVAGEWGHNSLPWPTSNEWPGPSCWCGRRGCIEAWVSGPGLARDDGRDLTAVDVVARAAGGEAHASASMARHADRLARALAMVINILDPDVVVLGGGLSNAEMLLTAVPQAWQPHVFTRGPVRTPLVRAVHGDASGVRGAAWLWPPEGGQAAQRTGRE